MHDLDLRMEMEPEELYEGDFESEAEPEYDEYTYEADSPMSEDEEMALASQLLEISNDEELDQFLGRVFRGVKRFAKSPAGFAIKGILKNVARRALPALGGAAGTMFGGPLGGMVGSRLATSAGRMFGLEVEGLSPEDQDFEVARRYVRLASAAARNAARMPLTGPPEKIAKSAIISAAKVHAPGLVVRRHASHMHRGPYGHWRRYGRRIVLFGVY